MIDPNLWCEVVSTLRHISSQLNQLASRIERAYRNASAPSGTVNRLIPPASPVSIGSEELWKLFHRRCSALGIELVDHAPQQPSNPVDRERRHLARFMVEHYTLIEPILVQMRSTLARPQKMHYSLVHYGANQLGIITGVGSRLYQLYILDYYQYLRNPRCMKFRARKQPFAQNFLSGQWFEMGLAGLVDKRLHAYPHLVLRNARFRTEKGGNFEVDILIGLWINNELRLAVLECKSAGTLNSEEIGQVRRVASLLNLGHSRCAVVFPKVEGISQAHYWCQQTGADMISLGSLPRFLDQLTV